jgi:hypothetical protein
MGVPEQSSLLAISIWTAFPEPLGREPISSLVQSLLENWHEKSCDLSGSGSKFASRRHCYCCTALRRRISGTATPYSKRSDGLQRRRPLGERRVIVRDPGDSYGYAPRERYIERRGYDDRGNNDRGGVGFRAPGVSVGIGTDRY